MSDQVRSTRFGRAGLRVLSNRALMRAPIRVFRAGFGFLFGSRLLMLEHIGRHSGARRYVVLEVFGRPEPGVYLVSSGFGTRAQWYRNVLAEPRVRVSVATRMAAPATARRLEQAEADAALADYVRRHPRAWARFKNLVEHTLGEPISEQDTALPIVELRLGQAGAAGC